MKTDNKNKFLRNEFLTLSILGALGVRDKNSPIYNKNIKEREKEEFKNFLRNKLIEYSQYYHKRVSGQQHIRNIEHFAKEATIKYKNILYKKQFRIGIAQKLNLYLKYLWVSDKIPEPPHCPFDNIILSKINAKNIRWTTLNSIKEYKMLVEKAKKYCGKKSLAEWELEIWYHK